jgi:hypothetical protein
MAQKLSPEQVRAIAVLLLSLPVRTDNDDSDDANKRKQPAQVNEQAVS